MYPPEHPRRFLRHCPHCGSADFQAVTDKEFNCRTCSFRFFPNSAAAVAAIIVHDGKIMLTRRAVEPWKGMLDLPGGFVDPGESAEEALSRELREELKANIISMRYIASAANRYIFSGYMVRTTDLAFQVEIDTPNVQAHDDIDAIEWHDVNRIPLEQVAAESIRNILARYVQEHAQL